MDAGRGGVLVYWFLNRGRDWYVIAEQTATAPHLAHLVGCASRHIVLVTVPRVSRSCEHEVEKVGDRDRVRT